MGLSALQQPGKAALDARLCHIGVRRKVRLHCAIMCECHHYRLVACTTSMTWLADERIIAWLMSCGCGTQLSSVNVFTEIPHTAAFRIDPNRYTRAFPQAVRVHLRLPRSACAVFCIHAHAVHTSCTKTDTIQK